MRWRLLPALGCLLIGLLCGWIAFAQTPSVVPVPTVHGAALAIPASAPTSGPYAHFAADVTAALEKKGLAGVCPMCHKNEWVIHDVPVAVPVYDAASGTLKIPGPNLPMALIACRHCGWTAFFSLGALDLADPTTQPATPDVNSAPQ